MLDSSVESCVTTLFIKKYKSIRNKVRNETRKLQMEEERLVASYCKENPKIFWKYVNSKRKICDHIGDLITDDKEGNQKLAPILKKLKYLVTSLQAFLSEKPTMTHPTYNPDPARRHSVTLYLVNKLYLIN